MAGASRLPALCFHYFVVFDISYHLLNSLIYFFIMFIIILIPVRIPASCGRALRFVDRALSSLEQHADSAGGSRDRARRGLASVAWLPWPQWPQCLGGGRPAQRSRVQTHGDGFKCYFMANIPLYKYLDVRVKHALFLCEVIVE